MHRLFKAFVVALCLAGITFAKKHPREYQLEKRLEHIKKHLNTKIVGRQLNNTTPMYYAKNISLPIDYSNPEYGNYSNQYFVMDTFYKPGSPIMIFDPGEVNDAEAFTNYMTGDWSFFHAYLKEFSAMGIVWEHRYYGKSKPFPVTINTTSEHMRFLTMESALKDVEVFANQFEWNGNAVNPKKVPWVLAGASYSGQRMAMLRDLYPETFYAAYASSAPMQFVYNYDTYFEVVYRGVVAAGFKNCTEHVRLAIDYIDGQLKNPDTAAKIKIQFLGRTADKGTNAGFSDWLTYPWWGFQTSGVADEENDDVILPWCNWLAAEAPPPNYDNVGKFYSDRWAAWPEFYQLVNNNNDFGYCEGPIYNASATPDCQIDAIFDGDFGISWTWQYCTEMSDLIPMNLKPGDHRIGSIYDTIEHQQQVCYNQFKDGLSSGYLPKKPETDRMNKWTNGWHIRPSNVFWTAGEFDPYRPLTLLSTEDWSPKFRITQDIPKCGVPTDSETVFGYIVPGAAHAYDWLHFPESAYPNELFAKALREWLKCFVPK